MGKKKSKSPKKDEIAPSFEGVKESFDSVEMPKLKEKQELKEESPKQGPSRSMPSKFRKFQNLKEGKLKND